MEKEANVIMTMRLDYEVFKHQYSEFIVVKINPKSYHDKKCITINAHPWL